MLVEFAVAFLALQFSSICAENLPSGAELVFPKVFDVRDDLGTRVLRVNDKITLNLKRSSVLHDEFIVLSYEYGVARHTYFDLDALEENMFEDEGRLATVFVSEESGSVKVEGVIGPNLKITPMEEMERGEGGHIPHALEAISKVTNFETVFGEHIQERNVTLMERSRRKDPYSVRKVYVELRLVVDETFVRGFRRILDMVRYLMIEYNCIKLRYLTVSNPVVKIKVRAIELFAKWKERKYYSYLSYDHSIDGLKTLYSLTDYVQEYNKTYGRYDIIFFITGLDMVAVQGYVQESNLQGFAFVGSVCTPKRVGLGEDKAYTYIGIRIMAHELGHTLGCSHDGSAIDGQFKNFKADSTSCPWEQGYLMSYIEDSVRSVKFSTCCDYSISLVAWSLEIDCLHHITTGSRLKKRKTRTLPGYFLGRNQQCRMTYPDLRRTYFLRRVHPRSCMAKCFVPGAQFHASDSEWDMLLIDGSRCNSGMVCINGECVGKQRRYRVRPVGK